MTLPALIRQRLDALAAAAQTGADALDVAALDLPAGTLAALADELATLEGRLDLVLDRLGAGVDPTGSPTALAGPGPGPLVSRSEP
jgi:hypothetical protein